MTQNDFSGTVSDRERGLEMSAALPVLMRKVYSWMTLALVITGFTAWGVANSPALLQVIYGSKFALIALVVAELALVWSISGRINKMQLSTATLLFALYSVLNGVTFASIFLVYTAASIAKVFFITAGTFGAMALVGYTTKRDLSKMGSILFMALIGLVIASLVNIFTHSSVLTTIISYVGVLIFVGLTAWDSQRIKEMLLMQEDAGETAQKVALLGALTLYLDFVNLFIYLLRIFGNSRD